MLRESISLSAKGSREVSRDWMNDAVEYEARIKTTNGRQQRVNSNQVGSENQVWEENTCIDAIFEIHNEGISTYAREVECSRPT